ncbi:MAG: alkaline phosphatase, partial [Crocosphaera sp.]
DETVEVTVDWIEENGGWEENLLIVTADHDHYMTLTDNFPALYREYGAEALTTAFDSATAGHYFGSDPEDKYQWGSHSNRPVPVYYQGAGSEVLDGFIGEGFESYGVEVPGIADHVDLVHLAQTARTAILQEETPEVPTEVPSMVRGTSGDDEFDTEDPGDSGFIGDNQLLFAGGGNDFVDVSFSAGGDRSRLDLGSGDDIIFAGSNNRIIAGSGDDMLFLGYGEGDNVVTGGSGMDQFWLTNDDIDVPTEANTITDFTIGEDVIGFGATALTFDDLTLTQNGLDTTINALGQDLAVLRRIESTDLSAADFAFG